MKTYPLYLESGELFAFEINNTLISNKKISLLLKKVPNITNIRMRKLFSTADSDVHIKFKYLSIEYIVWEGYGDSSRYWIGPSEKDIKIDISYIESIFSSYSLSFKNLFSSK